MKYLASVLAIVISSMLTCGECFWTHELQLPSGMEIKWNVTDPEWITMEISAPTKGYLGVGFSPTGSMTGSDIILGWVDSQGKPHLHDYHGLRNAAPVLDDKQDVELLGGSQDDDGTRLSFRRKWDTCDDDDIAIGEDTMKIIWAIGSEDPKSLDNLQRHAQRGVRSVFMKHHQKSKGFPDDPNHPNDGSIKYWDIQMDNYKVPPFETNYQCKIFKFPRLTKKHHLIAHRPLFTQGNENNIHHINVFRCQVPEGVGKTTAELFEPYLNHTGAECYSEDCPVEWKQYCFALQVALSVGSEGDILPANLGDPIEHGPDGYTYYKIEVHYDNPQRRPFNDSSGIRMFYTDNLRPMEISMLFTGHRRTPFMTIPPGQEDFKITGFCSADCTSKGFPEDGVTIYSVLLHAHLQGRKIILRQIRNGAELEPISWDNHYDFSYQQYRTLAKKVKIMPGDELIVECDYNTTESGFMFGGLSTRREMCEVFIQYYPKADLIDCRSQPEIHSYLEPLQLSLDQIESSKLEKISLPLDCDKIPANKKDQAMPDDAYVLEYGKAEELAGDIFDDINVTKSTKYESMYYYMGDLKWNNNEFTTNVQNKWAEGPHYMHCAAAGGRKIHAGGCVKYMQKYTPYHKPYHPCDNTSAGVLRTIQNSGVSHGLPLGALAMALIVLRVIN